MKTLKKNMGLVQLFFDFGRIEVTEKADGRAEVRISDFPPDFEGFYQLLRGWCARVLVLGGASNIDSGFTSKSWSGGESTSIDFGWV